MPVSPLCLTFTKPSGEVFFCGRLGIGSLLFVFSMLLGQWPMVLGAAGLWNGRDFTPSDREIGSYEVSQRGKSSVSVGTNQNM